MALITAVSVPGIAEADDGTIVFGRGKSLYQISATGKGKAREVAKLPTDASKIDSIHAAASGSMILVTLKGKPGFVKMSTNSVPMVEALECEGPAKLSPDGLCVVCRHRNGGSVLYKLLPKVRSKLLPQITGDHVSFYGSAQGRLVQVDKDRGILLSSTKRGAKSKLLAPHKPTMLLVAPNGKRAVGLFKDDGDAVFSFRLDGKGARRKLTNGKLVGWSASSKWVMVQDGDSACVVRATGGQYRCWRDYRVLSVSSTDEAILLSKKEGRRTQLYRASLGGARSAKPVLLVKNARGAAVWLAPQQADAKDN